MTPIYCREMPRRCISCCKDAPLKDNFQGSMHQYLLLISVGFAVKVTLQPIIIWGGNVTFRLNMPVFSVSSGFVSHLSTCKDYLLDFTNNEPCWANLRQESGVESFHSFLFSWIVLKLSLCVQHGYCHLKSKGGKDVWWLANCQSLSSAINSSNGTWR